MGRRQPQETRGHLALLPDRRPDSVMTLTIYRIAPEHVFQHHDVLSRTVGVGLRSDRCTARSCSCATGGQAAVFP